MKNTITWGVVWLICSVPRLLDAQTLYTKAGVVYRFGYPSMYIDKNFSSDWEYPSPGVANYIEDTRGVYGTFGKGMAVEGAVGINGKNLGIEVGVSYLFKSSIEAESKWMSTEGGKLTSSSTESFTHENTMITISPCLVLISNVGVYFRGGAVLGFPEYTYNEQYIAMPSATIIISQTKKYSGSAALGYTMAMGWTFGVGGIDMYVEGDFVSMMWAPARSEITQYTRDGIDILATLSHHNRNKRYEKNVPGEESTAIDPNSDHISLQKKFPYSSVGLKAGILIGF